MADDDIVMLGNTGGSQGGARPGPGSKLPGFLQKLFSDLTNSNVTLPNGQQQFGDPSQLAQTASQTLPSASAMAGPDVLNPSPTSQVPMPSPIQTPTFQQANQTNGLPGAGAATNPRLTTKGKVLATILQIAQGGLAGYAAGQQGNPREGYPNANVGSGFEIGSQLPFIQAMRQHEVKKSQLEDQFQQMSLGQMNMPVKLNDGSTIPLWQAMQQQKYDEVQATIGQKKAETNAIPIKSKLEQAQTEAAFYKDDPNLGLIDLRTGQPVSSAAGAPLSAEEAKVLGKQEGERVPLKLKNTASEIAARGITTVNTAEGVFERNRITGQQTRLGANPREITLDIPQAAYDKQSEEQVFVTRDQINRSPGRYASTQADLQLPVLKQTLKEYASTKTNTAGGNAIAFNTAIGHLGMLADAADALGNGSTPLLNSIAQRFAKETGSAAPTKFDTIKNAVNTEVAKVFKGGVPADAEIQEQAQTLSRASSPAQIKGAIAVLVGLMNSRINTLQDRYRSVVGEENEDLLSPESKRVIQKLQGGGNAGSHPLDKFWK